MNSEFSTKLCSGHTYQHVPEEYKAYCSIEFEKRSYKVQSLKNVLLRKSCLKFLDDIKMKKNSYLSTTCINLAEIRLCNILSIHVLILQSLSKSVEQSANLKKCTFEKIGDFLTKFDPFLGPLYNKDTFKECRKNMKITDLNSNFFLAMVANPSMKFQSELLKLLI